MGKKKNKQSAEAQKIETHAGLSRRHFLYLGAGSALLAGAAVLFGPRFLSRNPDYIFFPELHQRTPVAAAVSCASKNGVDRVALEGLPQGKIDAAIYAAYAEEYSRYRQDVDDFNARISAVASIETHLEHLVSKEVIIPNHARYIQNSMHDLASTLLNAYAYSHESKTVGNQFRYCKSLLDAGIEVHGVEDAAFYQKLLKEVYVPDVVNKFYQDLTIVKTLLAKAVGKAKTSNDINALQKISETGDTFDSILREKGLRKEEIPYGDTLTEQLLQERKTSVRQRSEIWLKYIQPLTSIMLIHGEDHTEANIEIAKKQGKTYKLAKEGLVQQ